MLFIIILIKKQIEKLFQEKYINSYDYFKNEEENF